MKWNLRDVEGFNHESGNEKRREKQELDNEVELAVMEGGMKKEVHMSLRLNQLKNTSQKSWEDTLGWKVGRESMFPGHVLILKS
jgi:hypothetical protein